MQDRVWKYYLVSGAMSWIGAPCILLPSILSFRLRQSPKWIATWHIAAESVGFRLCWSPQFRAVKLGKKSYFGFYSSGLLPGTEEQGQLGFNSAGRHNSVTRAAVSSCQKVEVFIQRYYDDLGNLWIRTWCVTKFWISFLAVVLSSHCKLSFNETITLQNGNPPFMFPFPKHGFVWSFIVRGYDG